jgi:hypothetical protein
LAREIEEKERLERLLQEEEQRGEKIASKRQAEIEKKQEEERMLEEAREKAKRDREQKTQDSAPDELLSFTAFGGFNAGMLNVNLSGQRLSELRSALKGPEPENASG